ncbi:MAG: acetyl-CoA carboxylase, carboxyltransferase subunit beta [Bacteroidota bacterium]
MAWFRRTKESISGESRRKDIPEGMWTKCGGCGEIIHKNQLEQSLWTCGKCNYHFRIGSNDYLPILLDEGSFKEFDRKMRSTDPLEFEDTKRYKDRIKEAFKKTNLYDAIRTGTGAISGMPVVIGCMDFAFIGGSMGSVVGEKVARAIDRAWNTRTPLIIVSSSGGARMMEAALSLMQMAKTSAKLARLSGAGIPYLSIMSDPTTGGVTASYAMLGDVNIAEPGALIGFAGPRVIKQAVGKDLPPGFQRSEFLLEHGFLDLIVHRKEMKSTVTKLLRLLWKSS